MVTRILTGIVGIVMLLNGISWLFTPADAAASLGMTLLEGIGRSSQIGDMGAFFLSIATFCALGAIRLERAWIYAAAIILSFAAVVRSLSWALHGAEFATTFIIVELVCAGLLVFSASRIQNNATQA